MNEKQPYIMNEWKPSNCSRFSALHDGDRVYCNRVYDGDTITLCWMDDRGEKVKVNCQIRDIEVPSLRGSKKEKQLARLAKNRLSDAVLYKIVTITREGKAQNGKVLSDIQTTDHQSISEYMLEDYTICKPFGTNHSW